MASDIKLSKNYVWQKIRTLLRTGTVSLDVCHYYYCCLCPGIITGPADKS